MTRLDRAPARRAAALLASIALHTTGCGLLLDLDPPGGTLGSGDASHDRDAPIDRDARPTGDDAALDGGRVDEDAALFDGPVPIDGSVRLDSGAVMTCETASDVGTAPSVDHYSTTCTGTDARSASCSLASGAQDDYVVIRAASHGGTFRFAARAEVGYAVEALYGCAESIGCSVTTGGIDISASEDVYLHVERADGASCGSYLLQINFY